MIYTVLVPPVALPVSLDQAKAHLRIDHDEEDTLLNELIAAASDYIEQETGRLMIVRTLRVFAELPADRLKVNLNLWPVREIVTVTGYDAYGTPQLLPAEDYELDKQDQSAALALKHSESVTASQNGLEIDLVAGHFDAPTDLPSSLTRALLVLVAHWYEFRGAFSASDHPASLPDGWDRLIAPHRRVRL